MFNKYACLRRKRKRQSFSRISFHTTSPQEVKVRVIQNQKNLSNTQLYLAVQRSRWWQNWLRLLIQSGHEDVQ